MWLCSSSWSASHAMSAHAPDVTNTPPAISTSATAAAVNVHFLRRHAEEIDSRFGDDCGMTGSL